MVVVLLAAGLAIQRRAERRPLAEPTRRRIGIAALGSLAAVPLVVLVGARVQRPRHRRHGLRPLARPHERAATPQNDPGRLIETGERAHDLLGRARSTSGSEHEVAGAGAGSFAQAQLRFRNEPTQGRHAHGYVHQTLADLGLIGLAASLLGAVAWLLAAGTHARAWRGAASREPWTPERTGLIALALVAVVFGVHSALDWTWFVPAVAVTGLFCAGWVAGRGRCGAGERARSPRPRTVRARRPARRRPARPRMRLARRRRGARRCAPRWRSPQPWRADREGRRGARALPSEGDFAAARAAASGAGDINPLSAEPYFERAAIEDAAGNRRAAVSALEDAVQLEPASPEAWRRLGEYYLVDCRSRRGRCRSCGARVPRPALGRARG